MIKLDYSQHKCPYPVVETRKQILANPGAALVVLVGDQAGNDNVSRLAGKMGYDVSAVPYDGGFCLNLSPLEHKTEKDQINSPEPHWRQVAVNKTVIYCGSDRMGVGNAEFGQMLMRNFLTTQLEMDPLPDMILFVNSGINLTTTNSEILEALDKLHEQGVDLASCGLCLEFYGKREQLKVGRVTNMYEMVDVQNSAARVICP